MVCVVICCGNQLFVLYCVDLLLCGVCVFNTIFFVVFSLLPPWQRRLCFWEHWFVCLFVCAQHYSNSYERIMMTFYGRVLGSTMKN